MEKCKEDLQKKIENVKTAGQFIFNTMPNIFYFSVALGREEFKQKQEELKKLDQHVKNIEFMQFSPELKKQIM
jgi:hypothetical protein